MNEKELAKIVGAAQCQVRGWEDATNDAHREVLALIAQAFDRSESAVLCEPSLARKTTTRPPDLVLIDPEAGVHVVEVKGTTLDQIEALEAGGQFRVRYAAGSGGKNPFAQARNAMFDVKDATQRAYAESCGGELTIPFRYWVALPLIRRAEWLARWGDDAFCPPELLFGDDLEASDLAVRFGAASRKRGSNGPVQLCSLEQMQCVWRAFGDSSVLYAGAEDRQPRKAAEGTLGEQFDEAAEAYKTLSDEQQKLSEQNWEEGPRLVRGVAGSGKTVVLANNLARRLQRKRAAGGEGELFDAATPRAKRAERVLAVCFNRTLAPFVRRRVDAAYRQRTGTPLPDGAADVCSYNQLMWDLSRKGLWRYQPVRKDDEDSAAPAAAAYLQDLQYVKKHDPAAFEAAAYDAVYVDEGQDFAEEDLRLLKELCRTPGGSEPNLYVFYDDAQNLYGRKRPNFQSLGLNVLGKRSTVMKQCFRNTRQTIEAAFNVLYGSFAPDKAPVPTREFGDLRTLEKEGLIEKADGAWRVRFAPRSGPKPRLSTAAGAAAEVDLLVARVRWLVGEQRVRPEDVLVLSFTRKRVLQLADTLRAAALPAVAGVDVAFESPDQMLGRNKGYLTASTVASAKGYDGYCVLVASANEFPVNVLGRASFYVGCTRASEYLEVLAHDRKGLAVEFEQAVARLEG